VFASRVIGHRGAATHVPENTLAGIRWAAANNISWIELDVSVLKDGTPVMFHDDTMERTSNGMGRLRKKTWPEIRDLDAGSWFSDAFKGERIPHLEEALVLVKNLGLGLNLELKTHDKTDLEHQALVSSVVPLLTKHSFVGSNLLVSSFDHAALRHFHKEMPDAAIGVLYWKLKEDWLDVAKSLDAISVNAAYQHLTEPQARAIEAAGYELYVYTPTTPADVAHMWSWGLDGVFADDPLLFLK